MPTFTVVIQAAMQDLVCTLTYLENMDLTYPNIMLFKTIFFGKCFLFNMSKWFTCVFLSGSFFLLLLATNLCLYGKNLIPGQFYMILPFVVFTLGWCTVLVLHYGKFPYMSSCKIIERWKTQLAVGLVAKRKYMRLLLKSMPPIAFPVGDIGIVDRDIQINYFDSLLNNMVNTSIIFQDLL